MDVITAHQFGFAQSIGVAAPVQVVDPSIDGAVNVIRVEMCVASCRQTQTARWR